MNLCRRLVSAIITASVTLGGLALADDVTRRSSRVPLRGDIVQEDSKEIVIRVTQGTSKGDMKVPLNDVQTVNYDGAAGLVLRKARNFERAGDYQKALEEYKAAESGDSEFANTAIAFGTCNALAAIALQTGSGLDQAVSALEEFRTAHRNSRFHYDLHESLGQLYLAKEDATAAREAFAELERAPWADYKLRAANWEGRILMKSGDFPGAMAALDKVISATTKSEDEQLRKQEAILLKGECLRNLKQYDEAEKLLREAIQNTPPEEAAIQASAHNALGDVLRAAAKPKDALLAYLYVELMYKTEHAEHARALYNLSEVWKEVERPDHAAAAREKLLQDYPDSTWSKRAAASDG